MTPEGTCNLPNILSGSSTGTGARTETGELGGKTTPYFLQCEPSNNGRRAHLPGMGKLSLCKDFLDIVGPAPPLHYCHTSTYGNKSTSQSSHCFFQERLAAIISNVLHLYLLDADAQWNIPAFLCKKSVTDWSCHFIQVFDTLFECYSVALLAFHTLFDTLYSVAQCGIVWHSMALLSGTLPGERRRPGWQEQQAVAARPTGLQEWTHQDPLDPPSSHCAYQLSHTT